MAIVYEKFFWRKVVYKIQSTDRIDRSEFYRRNLSMRNEKSLLEGLTEEMTGLIEEKALTKEDATCIKNLLDSKIYNLEVVSSWHDIEDSRYQESYYFPADIKEVLEDSCSLVFYYMYSIEEIEAAFSGKKIRNFICFAVLKPENWGEEICKWTEKIIESTENLGLIGWRAATDITSPNIVCIFDEFISESDDTYKDKDIDKKRI